MVVAWELPLRMAVAEHPCPRCSTTNRRERTSPKMARALDADHA